MISTSSHIKPLIASMQSLGLNEIVRIITLTGIVLARDLNVAERRYLGNTLAALGNILTKFPFSDSSEDDIKNKEWEKARDISIELLAIQKQLEKLKGKIEE